MERRHVDDDFRDPPIPTGSVRAAGGDDTLIAYEVETPTGPYRFVPLPNDRRYLLWNERTDWQEVFIHSMPPSPPSIKLSAPTRRKRRRFISCRNAILPFRPLLRCAKRLIR